MCIDINGDLFNTTSLPLSISLCNYVISFILLWDPRIYNHASPFLSSSKKKTVHLSFILAHSDINLCEFIGAAYKYKLSQITQDEIKIIGVSCTACRRWDFERSCLTFSPFKRHNHFLNNRHYITCKILLTNIIIEHLLNIHI